MKLVRSGEVSLLRGAQIAGLDFESFRCLLRDRAIPWEVEVDQAEQFDEAIARFFGDAAE